MFENIYNVELRPGYAVFVVTFDYDLFLQLGWLELSLKILKPY